MNTTDGDIKHGNLDFYYEMSFTLCEKIRLRVCGQRRLRSASTPSDQGLCCPQTELELLDTIECFNGEQMSG